MSAHGTRVIARSIVAGFATVAVAVGLASAGSAGAAQAPGLLVRCVRAIVAGPARGTAVPSPGLGVAVTQPYAALREHARPVATLPASLRVAARLGEEGVTGYDPGALARLGASRDGELYAIPAVLAPTTVPSGCGGLPQLAGLEAFLATQTALRGSGPGICLFTVGRTTSPDLGPYLPGAPRPRSATHLAITGMWCQSTAVLDGYVGALGPGVGERTALIPDGVSAITYQQSDGRQLAVPVTGNLAHPPGAFTIPSTPTPPTAGTLAAQLAAHLPTTITERGPSGQTVATFSRPDALVLELVGAFVLDERLFAVAPASRGSGSPLAGSSSGSSVGAGAWCQTSTHRCVAVQINSSCDAHTHCRIYRTIYRYRYVGARPPAGTTGADTQPTGPIVGRVEQIVRRPRRLSLVVTGSAMRLTVLTTIDCATGNGVASGGGLPLNVSAPSRTRLDLPGPGRSFQACAVGALVIATQRRRVHIHVRIVRS